LTKYIFFFFFFPPSSPSDIAGDRQELSLTQRRMQVAKFDSSVLKRQLLLVATAMLGVLVMCAQLWLIWYPDERVLRADARSDACKWIQSGLTVLLILQLAEYYLHQRRHETKEWFMIDSPLWSRHRGKFFLLEVIVLGWHQYPEPADYDMYGDSLGVLMFARIYLLARVMRNLSAMYRNRVIIAAGPRLL
jgi:hypothetical protein